MYNIVILSMKNFFVFANTVDPDEMLHHAAFHLGLHCLPKYAVTSIQRVCTLGEGACVLNRSNKVLWIHKVH